MELSFMEKLIQYFTLTLEMSKCHKGECITQTLFQSITHFCSASDLITQHLHESTMTAVAVGLSVTYVTQNTVVPSLRFPDITSALCPT